MSYFLLNNVTTVENTIPVTALSGASASATEGTGVDMRDAEGNILLTVDSTLASSGDTFTVTVEESAVQVDGATWAAIPSDALFNPDTGAAATFSVIDDATAAYKHQTLAIRKHRCKRYLRAVVTYAGSSITGTYVANFVIRKKLANWS